MKTIKTLKPHISLYVRNVEKSVEFYQKLFGIEPAKVRRGYAKFDVQNPPLNLAMNESPSQTRGALSHLGIQVAATEDVLTTKELWEAAGLLPREEMQTTCCYAVQDKAWVTDPDGNEWEVFVVLEDNLAETDPCVCGVGSSEETTGTDEAQTGGASESIPVSINRATEKSCC